MNDDQIDRLGRQAAGTLNAAVRNCVDTDHALRRVLDAEQGASVIAIGDGPPGERRGRRRSVLGIAAAAVVVVAGGFVLTRRDHSTGVVPVDSSVQTTPATTSTTASPSTTRASAQVQQASVTVNAETPLIKGTILYSQAVANTHPWFAAVTPSGRVFVGPSDGTTAAISEVVDGTAIPIGVVSNGDLRSALDERLYSIDVLSDQLVVWAQGPNGTWAIDQTAGPVGECQFNAQPDAVRCGDATIDMNPPVNAATLEWTGALQLTARTAEGVSRWAITLDSTEASVGGCTDDQCLQSWRVGPTDVAWTPVLEQSSRADARLAAVLHADTSPITAWLDCGSGCRIIGSRDGFIYTIGYGPGDAGQPSMFIRQFTTDFDGAAATDLSADAMFGWPSSPTQRPSLADVPMMLPSTPPAADVPLRREHADDPASVQSFNQFWFSETSDAYVSIETRPGLAPSAIPGDDVIVAPWDRAAFMLTTGGFEILELGDPSGAATISSRGLDRQQLLAIARSLQPGHDTEVGWLPQYLPTGLRFVGEGWTHGAATRTVMWADGNGTEAELSITHGVPAFLTPLNIGSTSRYVDINGNSGVAYQGTDRAAVVWSPQPDVTVLFGFRGSLDAALAIARSVGVVETATWEASSSVDTSELDGCGGSMFC
jgi:hypothetical protein